MTMTLRRGALLAPVVGALALHAHAQCNVAFDGVEYPAGLSPWLVSVGDLTGDGHPDLVSANGDSTLSVLINAGDGTFAAGSGVALESYPRSLASDDLNGDGRLDVVVASQTNGAAVLLGDGAGGFGPLRNYRAGSESVTVAIADFNLDSRPDLVVGNRASADVSILLGLGDGTFLSPLHYAASQDPYWIDTGDVNGDGRADVVVTNYALDQISVLLGNGDGSLQSPAVYATGNQPECVIIVDLNLDGWPDIVTGDFAPGGVSVLMGNGGGTFMPAVHLPVYQYVVGVTSGDVNADGLPDVIATADDLVGVLLGNGDGTFRTPLLFPTPGSNNGPASVGDLNGDGRQDLIHSVYIPQESVHVMLNTGDSYAPATIVEQPAGQLVQAGAAAVLSVVASSGLPISYQWSRNGVPLSDGGNISGATTSVLTIDPVDAPDEAIYEVLLTIPGCDGGTVPTTSDEAVLAVIGSLCPADFNGDGAVDTRDVIGFLNAWTAGCP